MLCREVDIIRALAPHPHIIRVHATCSTETRLSIVLQPVADSGDLAEFLKLYRCLTSYEPEKDAYRKIIQQAFGCLSHCLDYIHKEGRIVRHKDIKPSNILIHRAWPF